MITYLNPFVSLSFVTHGIELTRLTQFVTIMRIEKLLSSNTECRIQ